MNRSLQKIKLLIIINPLHILLQTNILLLLHRSIILPNHHGLYLLRRLLDIPLINLIKRDLNNPLPLIYLFILDINHEHLLRILFSKFFSWFRFVLYYSIGFVGFLGWLPFGFCFEYEFFVYEGVLLGLMILVF